MELKSGYKQTGVGLIPEEWERKPIGSFSAFVTKGATPTTYGFKWEDDGVLFLRSECVSDDGLDLTQSMFISHAAHAALNRGEVRSGDVLITITGNVGRVVLLKPDFGFANINQHIARIRVKDPNVLSDFVYHFLSQPRVRAYYISITTGQAYPQISLKQVRETQVPFPLPSEQRAIAGALSDVDTLIRGLDQLITKKRELKQAAMQQFLTGKQRLPGFIEPWEVKRLGDVGSFSKGKGIRKDEVVADGILCIRYGEIYTHHNDYIRDFRSFIPPEIAKQSQRLRKGDLLFAGSGETAEEIGKCVAFIGDEEFYAGGDIVIFTPTNQNSMYLGYLMNHATVSTQKARMGQGDAVCHISATSLAQLDLRLPKLKEQTAIATVLSDMDAEIMALEQRRDKTRALKQGMMQELLTGRIRLPVSATSEETTQQKELAQSRKTRHNWAFNEAVVIAALANRFGSREFPLGRLRYTKLAYLMHRHVEGNPEGYLKKAAGPYNPATRYKGPEGITQKNGYAQAVRSGTLSGFVSGENIDQALVYFRKWYGSEALAWLEQFRYEKNEALELLATVDMAILDLRADGKETGLENVKEVLCADPEWKPKLRREVFSDANIKRAIAKCQDLVG